MPLTVTTKRPDSWIDAPYPGNVRVFSRRAVATLEAAQDAIYSLCAQGETDDEIIADEIDRLPESGGTIRLPDGTVIEVEQVGWGDLAAVMKMEVSSKRRAVLDAYNARQS